MQLKLHCLGLLCLLSIGSILGCKPKAADMPEGLDRLASAFKMANQAEDIKPMMDLYYLEGADERTCELLKGALNYELGLPIESIAFEPLTGAPEETIDFVHQGVSYGPSLPPAYRMRVAYQVEDGFTSLFTVGRAPDGQWRIVCAKPLPELDI